VLKVLDSVHDTQKWDQFKVIDFKPKAPEDYDIDVKIEYCGICGSDVRSSERPVDLLLIRFLRSTLSQEAGANQRS
jgi:hypothetical protein